MKRCVLVLGMLLSLDSPVQAQDNSPSEVTFGSQAVATSRYIWRGFNDGGFSIQPKTWIEVEGFRVASWFNVAARPTERTRFNEQDITVAYSRTLGSYDVSGGWNGYFFPGGYGHSHEAFISIERKGLLTPSVAIYHDVRLGNGTYMNTAVSHPWPTFIPAVEFSSNFSVGYNRHHWTDATGFSDANIGVRATWRATERIALTPFINHSRSLNRSIVPTHSYGGIEVGVR